MLTRSESRDLRDDLCTKLGFCLPPAERQRLEDLPPGDVQAFTDAVLHADGLDARRVSRHLYRQVGDMVAVAFQRSGGDGA